MTELSSLLKRSFEGLGYCQGDYEDAAAAVVWLESRGMNGLDIIASTWPRLKSGVGIEVSFIADETGAEVLNANDSSVALCGRMVTDLVCAATVDKGYARIELLNCHGRRSILPSLAVCASRGLHAIAHWNDRNNLYLSSINAHESTPDLWRIPRQADDLSPATSLAIVCSDSWQPIETLATSLAGDHSGTRMESWLISNDMQVRYDSTIRHGLRIDPDLIRRLTTAADTVLVEATEQSRLGAGES